jgi:hypothetical protein
MEILQVTIKSVLAKNKRVSIKSARLIRRKVLASFGEKKREFRCLQIHLAEMQKVVTGCNEVLATLSLICPTS